MNRNAKTIASNFEKGLSKHVIQKVRKDGIKQSYHVNSKVAGEGLFKNNPDLDTKQVHAFSSKYSKVRQDLHEDLMIPYIKGKTKQKKPIAYILAGGGGSGKSFIYESQILPLLGADHVYSNADEFKGVLPESEILNKLYNERASGFLHRESSDIHKSLNQIAIKRKHNVVIDSTMKDTKKFENTIQILNKKGYEVHVVGVVCDINVALESVKSRRKETGRNVTDNIVVAAQYGSRATMERHLNIGGIKSFRIFSNSGQLEKKAPIEIYNKGQGGVKDSKYYEYFS